MVDLSTYRARIGRFKGGNFRRGARQDGVVYKNTWWNFFVMVSIFIVFPVTVGVGVCASSAYEMGKMRGAVGCPRNVFPSPTTSLNGVTTFSTEPHNIQTEAFHPGNGHLGILSHGTPSQLTTNFRATAGLSFLPLANPMVTRMGTRLVYANEASARMLTTPCLLYTSPSPRDLSTSRMPSSA